MGPRQEDPKTLDTGRVSLAMRARQTGDERYPFIRNVLARRSAAVLLVATIVAALGVAALLFALLR